MGLTRSRKEFLTITLKDGRKIGIAIYGNQTGFPVFYFHGFPGCRIEGRLLEPDLGDVNVKIVSPDRPGIGLSDRQAKRTLKDWAEDVIAIADILKLDQFGIVGISGGGPYALGCARYIPEHRIAFTFVISSMAPLKYGVESMHYLEQFALKTIKFSQLPMLVLLYLVKWFTRFRLIFAFSMFIFIKTMSKADKKLIAERDDLYDIFAYENYYTFKDDIFGMVQDIHIYGSDWGFDLKEIDRSFPIFLLHGTDDIIIPVEMGKNMAKDIPNCQYRIYRGEGHFSTAARIIDFIPVLKELMNRK